ncbi:MAG TPA: glycoside hydrolase family 16 protein, partial [Candidatus Limnocylindrales bacterium]|nr:glycoside hydrolase family 16 protein [Candidatus Limnocylindrales bacterium]
GFEDQPERSGEICIAEIFGRNIGDAVARVGMGIHPFGDPGLVDAFEEVPLALDPTTFHVYAAEWTPDEVAFYVDEALVKVVDQAPAYPMQIMLGLYQFGERAGLASIPEAASRAFEIDWFRGHRPRVG